MHRLRLKTSDLESSCYGSVVSSPTSIHEDAGSNPGLSQWEGSGNAVSCGVGHGHSSDLALLWLRCRLAATAVIRPLAWEPPYVVHFWLSGLEQHLRKSYFFKSETVLISAFKKSFPDSSYRKASKSSYYSFTSFFFWYFLGCTTVYGGSQARGWIGSAAADLCQSHSNARSLTQGARPGIKPTSSWILVGS